MLKFSVPACSACIGRETMLKFSVPACSACIGRETMLKFSVPACSACIGRETKQCSSLAYLPVPLVLAARQSNAQV